MEKVERIKSILRGEDQEKLAYGFWTHFPLIDLDATEFLQFSQVDQSLWVPMIATAQVDKDVCAPCYGYYVGRSCGQHIQSFWKSLWHQQVKSSQHVRFPPRVAVYCNP